MKYIIFLAVFLFSFSLSAQVAEPIYYEAPSVDIPADNFSYSLKRSLPFLATQFAAGLAKGGRDMLAFKYSQTIFPQGPDEKFLGQGINYWNPNTSWRNKWKNGDPRQGERFPLSSTALVATTDGWHMLDFTERTLHQVTIFSYRNPPAGQHHFKRKAVDFVLAKLFYATAFTISQSLLTQK